jgi:flagellin
MPLRNPLMEERPMGLSINTNIAAINTARTVRQSSSSLRKSLEKLSSGLRINRAADDAAGLAIAEGLRSQRNGLTVAQRNSQDGINLIQIAEGALSEIGNMLQRIRELAVQSANGTNTVANRTSLDAEAVELVAAINSTIAQTDFNGIKPFSAIAGGVVIQSGANAGETTNITALGTLFNDLSLSIDGTKAKLDTLVNANAAITNIDAGLGVLNSKRASLGAAQNRLEFTINVLAIKEENTAAAESSIRDADIARETTEFTRNQILVSAGTSILAQANIVPQTVLQLLG